MTFFYLSSSTHSLTSLSLSTQHRTFLLPSTPSHLFHYYLLCVSLHIPNIFRALSYPLNTTSFTISSHTHLSTHYIVQNPNSISLIKLSNPFEYRCSSRSNCYTMAENNMPIISKRVWSMVRVLYYMLRKGISKTKLQADIDLLLKRGKTAGKALIHSIAFPHLTSSSSPLSHNRNRRMSPPSTEYEFSCSNTPAYTFPIFHSKRNNNNKHSHFFGCTHAPRTNEEEEEEDITTANAVKMVLEMLNNHNDITNYTDEKFERMSVQPSPALPGFGKSPAVRVRQLRVTDSPFPLHDAGGDRQVDEKADKFIAKFYNDLKRQRILATPSPGRPSW